MWLFCWYCQRHYVESQITNLVQPETEKWKLSNCIASIRSLPSHWWPHKNWNNLSTILQTANNNQQNLKNDTEMISVHVFRTDPIHYLLKLFSRIWPHGCKVQTKTDPTHYKLDLKLKSKQVNKATYQTTKTLYTHSTPAYWLQNST